MERGLPNLQVRASSSQGVFTNGLAVACAGTAGQVSDKLPREAPGDARATCLLQELQARVHAALRLLPITCLPRSARSLAGACVPTTVPHKLLAWLQNCTGTPASTSARMPAALLFLACARMASGRNGRAAPPAAAILPALIGCSLSRPGAARPGECVDSTAVGGDQLVAAQPRSATLCADRSFDLNAPKGVEASQQGHQRSSESVCRRRTSVGLLRNPNTC